EASPERKSPDYNAVSRSAERQRGGTGNGHGPAYAREGPRLAAPQDGAPPARVSCPRGAGDLVGPEGDRAAPPPEPPGCADSGGRRLSRRAPALGRGQEGGRRVLGPIRAPEPGRGGPTGGPADSRVPEVQPARRADPAAPPPVGATP